MASELFSPGAQKSAYGVSNTFSGQGEGQNRNLNQAQFTTGQAGDTSSLGLSVVNENGHLKSRGSSGDVGSVKVGRSTPNSSLDGGTNPLEGLGVEDKLSDWADKKKAEAQGGNDSDPSANEPATEGPSPAPSNPSSQVAAEAPQSQQPPSGDHADDVHQAANSGQSSPEDAFSSWGALGSPSARAGALA